MPSAAGASASDATPSPRATPAPAGQAASGEQPAPGDGGQGAAGFELPRLRLHMNELSHPGARVFLGAVNAPAVLASAVQNVLKHLYTAPGAPHLHPPPTRSVTLILRDMGGVAYTTGKDLDDDHKEIHFSLPYIANIRAERQAHEITGVLTHELVHCFQHNAKGTAPGGLIEGIADWVRLQCGLAPPHWKKEPGGRWDGGYQHTAFFLEYLESRFGAGTVRRLNEKLRVTRYEEKAFWTESLGRPVGQLWEDYRKTFKSENPGPEDESKTGKDGQA